MQRALIVDADPSEQHRMAQVTLGIWPEIKITIAKTLNDAFSRLAHCMPGLLVADFYLPDGNGLDLIKKVRIHYPQSHRVIFTHHDDDRHILAALEHGVDGYLLKGQGDSSIGQLLGGVARGEPGLAPEVLRQVIRQFEQRQHQAESISAKANDFAQSIGLTPREVEVLKLLSRGRDRHQVAEALDIKPSTVAGHTKAIYLKLNVSTRAEATLAAVKLGLVEVKP